MIFATIKLAREFFYQKTTKPKNRRNSLAPLKIMLLDENTLKNTHTNAQHFFESTKISINSFINYSKKIIKAASRKAKRVTE